MFNNFTNINKYTTNENGEIIVENLDIGDYKLKEIKPTCLYIVFTNIIYINIVRGLFKILFLVTYFLICWLSVYLLFRCFKRNKDK